MQMFRERLPAPRLVRYITCVWVQQVSAGSSAYVQRTVPHGSVELVCEVGAGPRVVGPETGPTQHVLVPGSSVVGVRLRPGAAPAVLGLPASELVDLVVSPDEFWRGSAVALGEKLAAAASLEQGAAALEAGVSRRLPAESCLDPIVEEVVRRLIRGRPSAVRALASSVGISERQLRRRCVAATGFPPTVLHRMLRLQRFLAVMGRHGHASGELALMALEAGFADQAHLSREALRLAGRSPGAIVREAALHCRGHHDHSASYGPLLGSAPWRPGRMSDSFKTPVGRVSTLEGRPVGSRGVPAALGAR
ncbi:MAG TPA: helix-turn-helix domain-containing protein [Actinomycetes bacterium]|jgi:AraC-like DNA-binding protein|nr:helix-turn-helix domain-containing protein [Actinomycetes bacterium]